MVRPSSRRVRQDELEAGDTTTRGSRSPVPQSGRRSPRRGHLHQSGATNWFRHRSVRERVLCQRESRVQRLVYLRCQRQSNGLGRHRPWRVRRTTTAEGNRIRDRPDPLEEPRYGANRGLLSMAATSCSVRRPRHRRLRRDHGRADRGRHASATSRTAPSPTSSMAFNTSSWEPVPPGGVRAQRLNCETSQPM